MTSVQIEDFATNYTPSIEFRYGKHFITRMGLFITSWKVVSRREIQKTRLQEETTTQSEGVCPIKGIGCLVVKWDLKGLKNFPGL